MHTHRLFGLSYHHRGEFHFSRHALGKHLQFGHLYVSRFLARLGVMPTASSTRVYRRVPRKRKKQTRSTIVVDSVTSEAPKQEDTPADPALLSHPEGATSQPTTTVLQKSLDAPIHSSAPSAPHAFPPLASTTATYLPQLSSTSGMTVNQPLSTHDLVTCPRIDCAYANAPWDKVCTQCQEILVPPMRLVAPPLPRVSPNGDTLGGTTSYTANSISNGRNDATAQLEDLGAPPEIEVLYEARLRGEHTLVVAEKFEVATCEDPRSPRYAFLGLFAITDIKVR